MINNAGGTSPVGGAAVRFLSWNVKGLNGPVKRTTERTTEYFPS